MRYSLLRRNSSPAWCYIVLCLLLWLSHAIAPVAAESGGIVVYLPARSEECFFEEIPDVDVKVFLHYLALSGGSLDIDATISSPDGSVIWQSPRETEGRVLFKTRARGRHTFCFSNKMSTVSDKTVSFSIVVGEPNSNLHDKKTKSREIDSLESAVMRIQQGLREVQEVQQYIKVRERKHRMTTEVANTRVVVWSTIEIVVIALMGVGNIWYMRRIFNKRRIV